MPTITEPFEDLVSAVTETLSEAVPFAPLSASQEAAAAGRLVKAMISSPAVVARKSAALALELGANPDSWLEGATEHEGSWWEHWIEWLNARSGPKKAAKATLGSQTFPSLQAAPGSYVMETS